MVMMITKAEASWPSRHQMPSHFACFSQPRSINWYWSELKKVSTKCHAPLVPPQRPRGRSGLTQIDADVRI